MFDSTIFVSVYVAFVAAFATMEVFSFCLGLYLAKKQMQRQKAFEEEFAQAVAEGKVPEGVDPMSMMMGGGAQMPMRMPLPTVSGEVATTSAPTGQYL